MILEIFVLFLLLSVVAMVIGHFYSEGDAFTFIGLFILFFLSYTIMTGDLQYSVATTANITYTYSADNSSVVSSNVNLDKTYVALNDTTTKMLARFFALASAFGMVLLLYKGYKVRKERRENED